MKTTLPLVVGLLVLATSAQAIEFRASRPRVFTHPDSISAIQTRAGVMNADTTGGNLQEWWLLQAQVREHLADDPISIETSAGMTLPGDGGPWLQQQFRRTDEILKQVTTAWLIAAGSTNEQVFADSVKDMATVWMQEIADDCQMRPEGDVYSFNTNFGPGFSDCSDGDDYWKADHMCEEGNYASHFYFFDVFADTLRAGTTAQQTAIAEYGVVILNTWWLLDRHQRKCSNSTANYTYTHTRARYGAFFADCVVANDSTFNAIGAGMYDNEEYSYGLVNGRIDEKWDCTSDGPNGSGPDRCYPNQFLYEADQFRGTSDNGYMDLFYQEAFPAAMAWHHAITDEPSPFLTYSDHWGNVAPFVMHSATGNWAFIGGCAENNDIYDVRHSYSSMDDGYWIHMARALSSHYYYYAPALGGTAKQKLDAQVALHQANVWDLTDGVGDNSQVWMECLWGDSTLTVVDPVATKYELVRAFGVIPVEGEELNNTKQGTRAVMRSSWDRDASATVFDTLTTVVDFQFGGMITGPSGHQHAMGGSMTIHRGPMLLMDDGGIRAGDGQLHETKLIDRPRTTNTILVSVTNPDGSNDFADQHGFPHYYPDDAGISNPNDPFDWAVNQAYVQPYVARAASGIRGGYIRLDLTYGYKNPHVMNGSNPLHSTSEQTVDRVYRDVMLYDNVIVGVDAVATLNNPEISEDTRGLRIGPVFRSTDVDSLWRITNGSFDVHDSSNANGGSPTSLSTTATQATYLKDGVPADSLNYRVTLTYPYVKGDRGMEFIGGPDATTAPGDYHSGTQSWPACASQPSIAIRNNGEVSYELTLPGEPWDQAGFPTNYIPVDNDCCCFNASDENCVTEIDCPDHVSASDGWLDHPIDTLPTGGEFAQFNYQVDDDKDLGGGFTFSQIHLLSSHDDIANVTPGDSTVSAWVLDLSLKTDMLGGLPDTVATIALADNVPDSLNVVIVTRQTVVDNPDTTLAFVHPADGFTDHYGFDFSHDWTGPMRVISIGNEPGTYSIFKNDADTLTDVVVDSTGFMTFVVSSASVTRVTATLGSPGSFYPPTPTLGVEVLETGIITATPSSVVDPLGAAVTIFIEEVSNVNGGGTAVVPDASIDNGTTWNDSSLVEGRTFGYTARSAGTFASSTWSDTTYILMPDVTAPIAPVAGSTLVQAGVRSDNLWVGWTFPSDNSPPLRCRLQEHNNAGTKLWEATIAGTLAHRTGLTPSTWYKYVAFFQDNAGNESAASDTLEIQTRATTQSLTFGWGD